MGGVWRIGEVGVWGGGVGRRGRDWGGGGGGHDLRNEG